jgi:hypothetical protein
VEETVKWFLQEFGPIAIGWLVAGFLGYRILTDAAANRLTNKDVLEDFHNLIAAYHTAVIENTKVTERLAILIEERTRARRNGQG